MLLEPSEVQRCDVERRGKEIKERKKNKKEGKKNSDR
jgi:hypothetical protein